MTSLATLRRRLLADPEVKAEYDRLGPIFAVIFEMTEARRAAGLTQAEIAARMGTTQSVIARLENARHMPTFEMIARYAAAIGRRVEIRLAPTGGDDHAVENEPVAEQNRHPAPETAQKRQNAPGAKPIKIGLSP